MTCVAAAKKNGSELECVECGSKFYRRFGEQDLGERVNQFCCRECYFKNRDHGKSYKKVGARHLHRIVAEEKIGRSLKKKEVVHHKDDNKRNNNPSNLRVFPSQSAHARFHMKQKCKTTTKAL